jgi:hypothetical protein
MKELQGFYEDLQRYSDFKNEENTEKFLEVTDKIILQKNAGSIKEILKYFDDNTEYSWVFESLGSALEYYPKEIYVKELIKNLQLLLIKGPFWADNFFNKIFNHPSYRQIFIKYMHLTSKKNLERLFDVMLINSPHHKDLIEELRKELQENHS